MHKKDGARVKRNVRNFKRGTAVRKDPQSVRITRRLSEKVAKRRARGRFAPESTGGTVMYKSDLRKLER